MYTQKLHPGDKFRSLKVKINNNDEYDLLYPEGGCDWQLVIVYRGKHCPMCTKYLNEFAQHTENFRQLGVSIVAVSGDSKQQLATHMEQLTVDFPLAYGLTLEQMHELGLYVSEPRSQKETDHPFAEPGLFIVNEHGELHVVDISNNPFVRPSIDTLLSGVRWIRDPKNNYPIRGAKPY